MCGCDELDTMNNADSTSSAPPADLPRLDEFALALDSAANDPALRELGEHFAKTNIFRILGTDSRERWHSAFLAWALDPSGSHGSSVGLRRVLYQTVVASAVASEDMVGRVRGRLLTLERAGDGNDEISFKWQGGTTRPPTLSELAKYDFGRSIAAPGPQSGFKEVSVRALMERTTTRTTESAAERGRFDVLVGARLHPRSGHRVGDAGNERPIDMLLFVAETKVQAVYDPDQLVGYSSWLHKEPSPEGLTTASLPLAQFAREYRELLEDAVVTAESEKRVANVLSVGVFVSPRGEVSSLDRAPERLDVPWTTLTYDAVAGAVLEPMRADQRLPVPARVFLNEYLHLLAHSDPKLMTRVLREYEQLANEFIARNRDTLRVVARVLQESRVEMDEMRAVGAALSLATEEAAEMQRETERRGIFSPRDLARAGLLKLPAVVGHDAVKKRDGGKPFEEHLRARITAEAKSSFELIEGPALALQELGGRSFTSTGLLKAVYGLYGATYSASGNDGWKLEDAGEGKNETLATLYSKLAALDE